MRTVLTILTALLLFGVMTPCALASERNTGLGIMAGYSVAKGNDAVEDIAIGAKWRLDTWEAAFDIFRSKFPNGGYDKMGVLSLDYTWDFARIPQEDFGIYLGSGISYLGAADVWKDDFCWNLLVGYDYTSSWSIAGRFFITLQDGNMFAVGGFTYLF
jgi:hypothetical protein